MRNPVKLDRSAASIVLTCRLCPWREVVTRVTGSAARTALEAHVQAMHPPRQGVAPD